MKKALKYIIEVIFLMCAFYSIWFFSQYLISDKMPGDKCSRLGLEDNLSYECPYNESLEGIGLAEMLHNSHVFLACKLQKGKFSWQLAGCYFPFPEAEAQKVCVDSSACLGICYLNEESVKTSYPEFFNGQLREVSGVQGKCSAYPMAVEAEDYFLISQGNMFHSAQPFGQ